MSRIKLKWELVMEEHYTMRQDEDYHEEEFIRSNQITDKQ
jgi:hypothetical protein